LATPAGIVKREADPRSQILVRRRPQSNGFAASPFVSFSRRSTPRNGWRSRSVDCAEAAWISQPVCP